jgi:hypothetical protein
VITLRRLDLVRADSSATADELASLQMQINAQLQAMQTRLQQLELAYATLLPAPSVTPHQEPKV